MISTKLVTSIITAAAVASAVGITVVQAEALDEYGTKKDIESTGAMRPAHNFRYQESVAAAAAPSESAPPAPAAAPEPQAAPAPQVDSAPAPVEERAPRADRN